ncbi:hypothetical protein E2562_020975 [Oryza meyeriana var. granulata]|uniref:DUF1618 domain-containing protein n=1 Tax=Oryza meyeriana var. granulata TaxID=110450 RepID=A0A6G1DZQ5_9ORYZ|nr:hypothetical protein E2562_020975 [Oryza meyeriana var. granulata]
MAPPPSSPSWVILSRKACTGGSGLVLTEGAGVSLELAAPPRVTVLSMSPRVSPTKARFLALDPSAGLVLLSAPSPADSDDKWPRYFVCDVAAATASRVPYPVNPGLNGDLGVITAPGGGGNYMVVEFQPTFGDDGEGGTILLCFSSKIGRWVFIEVDNPLPNWYWIFDNVVSHDGKLWWVDTLKGLVFCDPFANEAGMEYVPLDPQPEDYEEHNRELANRRIVQLSDGKFRRVEMSPASNGAAPELSMRTLVDPETAEWTLEYAVSFADIWERESYKATELPEKAPRLMGAFVHPKNPDVVYFFLEKQLLGVDLRARKVVEYEARVSSDEVLPWELPPALSADLSPEGAANGANGVPPESLASFPPSDPNGA